MGRLRANLENLVVIIDANNKTEKYIFNPIHIS